MLKGRRPTLTLTKFRGTDKLSTTFRFLSSPPSPLSSSFLFLSFFFLFFLFFSFTKLRVWRKVLESDKGFLIWKSHELLRISFFPILFPPFRTQPFMRHIYPMDPFVKLSMYPAYVLFFLFFFTSCIHKAAVLVAWEVDRLQLVVFVLSKVCYDRSATIALVAWMNITHIILFLCSSGCHCVYN